jgi:hypothetical protein
MRQFVIVIVSPAITQGLEEVNIVSPVLAITSDRGPMTASASKYDQCSSGWRFANTYQKLVQLWEQGVRGVSLNDYAQHRISTAWRGERGNFNQKHIYCFEKIIYTRVQSPIPVWRTYVTLWTIKSRLFRFPKYSEALLTTGRNSHTNPSMP